MCDVNINFDLKDLTSCWAQVGGRDREDLSLKPIQAKQFMKKVQQKKNGEW
jgi:hypothetical protein